MEQITCRNPDPCESRVVTPHKREWLPYLLQFVINLVMLLSGAWLGHAWQKVRYEHAASSLRSERDHWRTAYESLDKHADAIQSHFDQHHDEDAYLLKQIQLDVKEIKRGKK